MNHPTQNPKPKTALPPLSPEEELIILSARLHFDEESTQRYENALKADLDWTKVLDTAHRLSIAPLLYKHLTKPGWRDKAPKHVHKALKTEYQKSAFRSIRIQAQIQKINQAAADLQTLIIFLKGAAISGWLYEDISLRPMRDIDILCQKKDNPQIDRILKGLGYSQDFSVYKSPIHKTMTQKMTHLAPYTCSNAISIEVHNYIFGDNPIEREIWKNGWIRQQNRTALPVLNPEWMLLQMCLHLEKHMKEESFTLYWFSDFLEFLRKHKKTLDTHRFLKLADHLHAKDTVCGILGFVALYGGLQLPTEICDLNWRNIELTTLMLDPESKNRRWLQGLIGRKQALFQKVYTEYGPIATLCYGIRILFPPKQYVMNLCASATRTQFLGHYLLYSYNRLKNAFVSIYMNFDK